MHLENAAVAGDKLRGRKLIFSSPIKRIEIFKKKFPQPPKREKSLHNFHFLQPFD
jgi:hypothetical protein